MEQIIFFCTPTMHVYNKEIVFPTIKKKQKTCFFFPDFYSFSVSETILLLYCYYYFNSVFLCIGSFKHI